LEEFEKAVEAETDAYVGEGSAARHNQFVEAIRTQLKGVEQALPDTYKMKFEQAASSSIEDSNSFAGLWMPQDCYNGSCCGGSLSLNWRSSSSSSLVLLLLPLLLLVLLATDTIAPCSSFVDPVHVCCTRLDPTYVNLQPCS
jgi:hypothetical protein